MLKFVPGLQIGGRYILKECLDTGGQAQVWKANQETREVAIKLRPPVKFDSREDVKKRMDDFTNEKEAWVKFTMSSVYIVHILDVVSEVIADDDKTEWLVLGIVSELSELGDLQRAIENKSLRNELKPEAQLIQFLLHIISGVKAGHDEQRYHCDIKPKNILLFRDGGHIIPKLTDFGIAGTALELVRGYAPGYSAPELASGGTPTAQSDIYSLGITFYDILYATILNPDDQIRTGSFYKSGKEYKQYLTETFEEAPKSRFSVPYKNLIASMANEDPAQRPTLDQIITVLETSLFGGKPPYPVKTKPDAYVWSPAVHKVLQEKLHYILVKGGNPTIDLRNLVSNLKHAGFTGFSLRSVIGAWDYVARIWIPQSPMALSDVKEAVDLASHDHMVLEVTASHFASPRNKKSPRTTETLSAKSDADILKEIERCAIGPGPYDKLLRAGYVVSQLNKNDKFFRVTLLVSIPREHIPMASVLGGIVKDTIVQSDAGVTDMRCYDVKPVDAADVRLVVKFMHKDFVQCRKTLLKAFAALAQYGNHFKFSTLLDMNAAMDCLSDDGNIIARIGMVHSGGI